MNIKIFLVSGKSHNGKGEFSRELERLMKNEGKHVIRCSLSTYIRDIAKNDFYWDGVDTPEIRTFMAEVYRLGTEVYEFHMARRVWERDILPNLNEKVENYVIVESFREKQNYDYFKILMDEKLINEIVTIRINRPQYDDINEELKAHVSEVDLDDFNFDYEIYNDKDLDNLKVKTYEFLKQYNMEKFY